MSYYKLLGHSGLRVSPLCLGTMGFGDDWGWGAPREASRQIFDRYADWGGNFIDTANFYTNGTSETLVGEFVQGRRDQFVVATKYTLGTRPSDPNAGGNQRKNMVQALEASLKRLQTDYIDLYYVHVWEYRTPVEEVMRGLDDLVRAGKVLYVGISDTPAWKVAQANTLASLRGWAPFIGLQVEYSLVERDVERELTPMARELGLGVLPWSPLNAGVLTGKYNPLDEKVDTDTQRNVGGRLDERKRAISTEVQTIAREIGCSPAQVALQWLLRQPAVTSPIVGARTLAQLDDNLGALNVTLDDSHLQRLEAVSKIERGHPHNIIEGEWTRRTVSNATDIR